jgi:hypothetical protein
VVLARDGGKKADEKEENMKVKETKSKREREKRT